MCDGSRMGKARERDTEMPRTRNILKRMVRLTLLASVGFAACLSLAQTDTALAATSPTLGNAAPFAVLGGSTVTNTGPTVATGDLGVSPGSAVTGFPPGIVVPPGTIHAGDAVAAAAQADNTAAFGFLDQPCTTTYAGVQDLTTVSPLGPGVYCANAFLLTGNLTLSGSGVWIFKSASTLTTSAGSSVTGGDSCNVWWRLVSSGTLGTNTSFIGNILASTSIALNTGARLNGRALAQTGAVTLDDNTINASACSGVTPSGVGVSKVFGPATMVVGGVSTLTISLSNANAGAATITSFTDNLPSGMVIATPSGASTTCIGSTLTANSGANTVMLTAGTIPAAASGIPGVCTITVHVTAATPGSYTNTLPANALQTNIGNNTASAGAILSVSTATATAVPTMTEWGMIIFMGLAGLGSVYFLSRRRV